MCTHKKKSEFVSKKVLWAFIILSPIWNYWLVGLWNSYSCNEDSNIPIESNVRFKHVRTFDYVETKNLTNHDNLELIYDTETKSFYIFSHNKFSRFQPSESDKALVIENGNAVE